MFTAIRGSQTQRFTFQDTAAHTITCLVAGTWYTSATFTFNCAPGQYTIWYSAEYQNVQSTVPSWHLTANGTEIAQVSEANDTNWHNASGFMTYTLSSGTSITLVGGLMASTNNKQLGVRRQSFLVWAN